MLFLPFGPLSPFGSSSSSSVSSEMFVEGAKMAFNRFTEVMNKRETQFVKDINKLYREHLISVRADPDSEEIQQTFNFPPPFMVSSNDGQEDVYKAGDYQRSKIISTATYDDGSYEYRESIAYAQEQIIEYRQMRLNRSIFGGRQGKDDDGISRVCDYILAILDDCKEFSGYPHEKAALAKISKFIEQFSLMKLGGARNDFMSEAIVSIKDALDNLERLSHNKSAQQNFQRMSVESNKSSKQMLRLAGMLMMGEDKHRRLTRSRPHELKDGVIQKKYSSMKGSTVSRNEDNPYAHRFKNVARMIDSAKMEVIPGINDSREERQKRAKEFIEKTNTFNKFTDHHYHKDYQKYSLKEKKNSKEIEKTPLEETEQHKRARYIDTLLDLSGLHHQFEIMAKTVSQHAAMSGNLAIYNKNKYKKMYNALDALHKKIESKYKSITPMLDIIDNYGVLTSGRENNTVVPFAVIVRKQQKAFEAIYKKVESQTKPDNYSKLVKRSKRIERELNEYCEFIDTQYSLSERKKKLITDPLKSEKSIDAYHVVRKNLNKLLKKCLKDNISDNDHNKIYKIIKNACSQIFSSTDHKFRLYKIGDIRWLKRSLGVIVKNVEKASPKIDGSVDFLKDFINSAEEMCRIVIGVNFSSDNEKNESIKDKNIAEERLSLVKEENARLGNNILDVKKINDEITKKLEESINKNEIISKIKINLEKKIENIDNKLEQANIKINQGREHIEKSNSFIKKIIESSICKLNKLSEKAKLSLEKSFKAQRLLSMLDSSSHSDVRDELNELCSERVNDIKQEQRDFGVIIEDLKNLSTVTSGDLEKASQALADANAQITACELALKNALSELESMSKKLAEQKEELVLAKDQSKEVTEKLEQSAKETQKLKEEMKILEKGEKFSRLGNLFESALSASSDYNDGKKNEKFAVLDNFIDTLNFDGDRQNKIEKIKKLDSVEFEVAFKKMARIICTRRKKFFGDDLSSSGSQLLAILNKRQNTDLRHKLFGSDEIISPEDFLKKIDLKEAKKKSKDSGGIYAQYLMSGSKNVNEDGFISALQNKL